MDYWKDVPGLNEGFEGRASDDIISAITVGELLDTVEANVNPDNLDVKAIMKEYDAIHRAHMADARATLKKAAKDILAEIKKRAANERKISKR